MAGGIIYLDVDDEITSAAARIRGAESGRVVVVLPYGSRVATSRINFRLLARDAQSNGKRLSVVAGDAATRALAASAGLPIFGTVAEYESSLEGADAAEPEESAPSPAVAPIVPATTGAVDDPAAIEGTLWSETVATPRTDRPSKEAVPVKESVPSKEAVPEESVSDDTAPLARLAAAVAATRPTARVPAAVPAARVVADTPHATETLDRPGAGLGQGPVRARPAGRARPDASSWRTAVGRTPLVVGAAVLGLAVVVVAVGAFILLPTATAVITPRTQSIGPISLRIRADTSATAPDLANAVVPAERITIPLEAADTFPATGTRVEETKARGVVRFDNLNPTGPNTIPKGSVVSTNSGVRFRTDTSVTVPAAELVGLTIIPSRATVKVTAVDAGPEGNVEPNTVLTVPRGEEPLFLKVTNPDATTGGKREEFPRVTQEDVDKAVAALRAQLSTAFDDRLDDPDLPGDTGTVFSETKSLGEPVFGVDPNSLVGQEVETFELSGTAQGTVVAVDTAPVRQVAEARIASRVDDGFELIGGSSEVRDATAEVSGGVITFPVVVTAREVLVLDPAAIEAEIMGKTLAEARAILATYGEASLVAWPDWVGTVPTLDSRVEVQAAEASP